MDILTAHREKKSTYSMVTTLKDKNNKVVKIVTGYNQPTKRNPYIVLKGKTFNLKFIDL